MSIKEDGDQAAVDLVRKRWDKTPPEQRSAHARKMARARWGTTINEAAAQMGRKGGKKKVPKGFALMDEEQKREIQSKGGKARWNAKGKSAKKK